MTLDVCGMTVESFPTSHDVADPMGFRFALYSEMEGDGSGGDLLDAIGWMTDTGYVTDAALDGLYGVRILGIESNHDVEMLKNGPYPAYLKKRILSPFGHLSNDQCAEVLPALVTRDTETVVALHLSEENYEGGSVASVAVACHEAGHAVQTAQGYAFGKFRTALVPVVNFTQQVWGILFVVGVFSKFAGLTMLAIGCFAFSVLFQLVTLPVEIDASRRAVRYLAESGSGVDERGARSVLIAAALTYVAAALISVLQLLYLLGRSQQRR
jgi:hypothetical protein